MRPKPPTQTKAQLMAAALVDLQRAYPDRPFDAAEYLLNFFTAIDLVAIREDLERRK